MDETYERVLNNIKDNDLEDARRLLHCLAVAVRPLRVDELAEILRFDFDTAQGGIPKYLADRRSKDHKDQDDVVLSLCSSLITVVDNRGSRVVQFSHLSVKEFLTSNHLASSTGHLSRYHILPGPAHTILAQVCLGLLLHPDDGSDNMSAKDSPLAEYAARHWIAHAQFEDVASSVKDGMEALFDHPGRTHFTAWIGLHDIDAESGGKLPSEFPSPLYHSSLCGFPGLVQHIAKKHQEHVNAIGGSLGFPLVAALRRNHFVVAELLLEHGGRVDVRDGRQQTVLHQTIDRRGESSFEAVRFLLERGADVNAQRDDLWTPLHLAANMGDLSVARMLLEHKADANSRNDAGQTPLHVLSTRVISQDEEVRSDIAKLLLEHDANVNEKDKDNATPLHVASYHCRLEIARVLLEHDANVNEKGKDNATPLHVASSGSELEIARELLEHGANADAENDQGRVPLQLVFLPSIICADFSGMQEHGLAIALLLLEHGAQVYARDKYHISTSDLACSICKENSWQMLVGSRGNFNPENDLDMTAFRVWIYGEYYSKKVVSGCHTFFVECGADRSIQDKYDSILLHSASYHGRLEMVRMLLDHSVKSSAKNLWGETALLAMSGSKHDSEDSVRLARLLLERGVDVNMQDNVHNSPLHSASYSGKVEIVRVLLYHGAIANAKNNWDETPLHQVSLGEYKSPEDGARIAQLLLDRGVDVNPQDNSGVTPLHLASRCGKLEIARLLVEHVTSKNNRVRTALHVVEGEYYPQESPISIIQTYSRAHPRLRRTRMQPGNPTTLCMLPGGARDRTFAS